MAKLILLLLNCFLLNVAFAQSDLLFSLKTTGRDVMSMNVYDQIEIYQDLRVIWSTASKGWPCPGEAGTYSGIISQAKLKNLLALAKKVEGQQAKSEVKTTLSFKDNSEMKGVQVNGQGTNFAKLNSEVALLKRTLIKGQGISMQAGVLEAENGSKIVARFALVGEQPLTVILPTSPEDTFFLKNHARLIYVTPPPKRTVLLGPTMPSATVEFSFPKGSKVKPNSLFYHATVPELKMEIFLCGEL